MNPATVNQLIQAGLLGIGGLTGVPGALAAGFGKGVGPGSPAPFGDIGMSGAQGVSTKGATGVGGQQGFGLTGIGGDTSSLAQLAQQHQGGTSSGSIGTAPTSPAALGPTLGGQAPTRGTTMGYPSANPTLGTGGIQGTPAPPGSPAPADMANELGSPAPFGLGTSANAPSPSANTVSNLGADTGLTAAAQNAVAQSNPAAPTSPSPSTVSQVAQASPDLGSIFGLIASLVSGGAGGPSLGNLAQSAGVMNG
jgi:hypothetical protein